MKVEKGKMKKIFRWLLIPAIVQPCGLWGFFCHLFVEKGGAQSHPVYAFGLRVHPKSYSGRLKRVCKQTGPSVYAFWMHSLNGVGIDGEGQKEKWKVEK